MGAGRQGHGTTLWQIAHTFIQGLSTLFASRYAGPESSIELFQPYHCVKRRRRYRVERRFCCQFRYSTNFHFIPLRLPLQNRDPSKSNAATRTSTSTFTTTSTTPRLLRRRILTINTKSIFKTRITHLHHDGATITTVCRSRLFSCVARLEEGG